MEIVPWHCNLLHVVHVHDGIQLDVQWQCGPAGERGGGGGGGGEELESPDREDSNLNVAHQSL